MLNVMHGYCLRLLRKQLRLTQVEIASYMGIKKSRYTKIECGYVLANEEELRCLFDTLNVDYAEYMSITNFIHKEWRRDTGYVPSHSKYFGCLLPIPALQKVTLDLLRLGFKFEEELRKRTVKD